ncbi:hypothetical protein GE061_011824 [Apolygus lucorum]|uniref:Uncharacterized protein n=1 Tax=Apolygus lucorum TaxID=248454 RepID=A0A6A4JRD4_APOLU|nr:hypothetical protein GE061_011824 [Apolygus lucorum]
MSSGDVPIGINTSKTDTKKKYVRTCPCDPRLKVPDTEIEQATTLLKYTNPFKVVMNIRKTDIKPKPVEIGAKAGSELLTDNSPETQEVLDCIQEPRMWMENGELWTQVVSPATTKRNEILLLYDDVDRRLWMRHARPFGICRIRYEIMRQLFDELTRQVTVTCAERGLFLVRIRAELTYTIQIYHYMWRDIMEYFDPIVRKSVETMAHYRHKVEVLEGEIKNIREEMEDVQWKTLLMEQEKAYDRQATLEWYRCRIEEEKLQMVRLATLVSVMSTGDFNVTDTADILSLNEDQDDSRKTRRMGSDLDVEQALQLSDTLKELIQERKVAEGRTKTKRLLEDEIIWARGEISKNKAYLTDIVRLKEPLDFDKWLQNLVQGNDEPTEIAMFLGYDKIFQPPSITNDQDMETTRNISPDSLDFVVHPKMNFMKWLMSRKPDQCKCKGQECRQEQCSFIDWDLLLQQARAEFLHGYDDHPLLTFNNFFENWLLTKDVQQIYALSHFFEDKKPPQHVSSIYSVPSMSATAERALSETISNEKLTFLEPNEFVKRVTEFRLPKNPYKLQSSSVRPVFRNKGRMMLKGATLYADPFAPRSSDPCARTPP